MKKETIIQLISGLIAALFFYAAMSKLMGYEKSQWEMKNQIFSSSIASVLTWLIPATEIIMAIFLLFFNTRKKALWASLFLLSGFTLYIAIVMTGVFGRVPCSCGGILKNMGYGMHILFNLCFIALAIWGIALADSTSIFNRWFHLKRKGAVKKIA